MIFLSIIIPTYNRCERLKRSVQSALSSDSNEIEVLVSDNASTDATPETISRFHDPRLRHWRNPENIGPERNFYTLLKEARGKWVLVLTDDDFILPGKLNYLIAELRTHPNVGMVLSDLEQCDEAGGKFYDYSVCPVVGVLEPRLPSIRYFFQGAHVLSRIVFRRELMDLEGMRRHDGSMYPQMYLAGDILKHHPALYLAEPIICHTVGNPTFWAHRPDFSLGFRVRMIKELFPWPKYAAERKFLLTQLFSALATHQFEWWWRDKTWLRSQLALVRTKEVLVSPVYWSVVGAFLRRKWTSK